MTDLFMAEDASLTPQSTLNAFERKLALLAQEYASGVLNAAQYNAVYRYYSEKRALVAHIASTNPDNPTWRIVAQQDDTASLREQFESRLLYCAVFRRGHEQPLLMEGKIPRSAAAPLLHTLQPLWSGGAWRRGMARKALGEGVWLVLCLGEWAMTAAVFFHPPSGQQHGAVREVHDDFEAANARLLARGVAADRLVYPQRSLFEGRGG